MHPCCISCFNLFDLSSFLHGRKAVTYLYRSTFLGNSTMRSLEILSTVSLSTLVALQLVRDVNSFTTKTTTLNGLQRSASTKRTPIPAPLGSRHPPHRLYSSNGSDNFFNNPIEVDTSDYTTYYPGEYADDSQQVEIPQRNLENVFIWASQAGMKIAPGLQFVEDNWSYNWGMSINQSYEQGTSLLTIPRELMLSSQDE